MAWRKEGVAKLPGDKTGIIISEGVNSHGDGPERYVGELYEATKADQALILAAPELLDAVEMLVEWIEDNAAKPAEVTELRDARAAIAKAMGVCVMFKPGFHRTRDGRKAIVLTTNAPGAYPLVGYIERPQTVQPMAWRADGAVSNYGEGADDIVPHAELHPAMAEALRPFLGSRCDV